METRARILNSLVDESMALYHQQMRRRAIVMLTTGVLFNILGLGFLFIDFPAIGVAVTDYQVTALRGVGYLSVITGFLGLVNFILSKALEQEDARLKRMVADLSLDKQVPEEIVGKKW